MAALESLDRWLESELGFVGIEMGPRLGGGNSNVTQLVRHAKGRVILRRPPDDTISSTAGAGVLREYGMLKALYGRAKVPRPLAYCADASIVGQPFSIIEYVDGISITESLPQAYTVDAATISNLGIELVDELATLHTVDWRSVGMSSPKMPEDYVAKQIARLRKLRAEETGRPLPLIEDIAGWLTSNLPPPPPATVMHGDFHLDNTLFSRDAPKLSAIIDWELATIGNPYADLALMLAFWGPRSVNPPGFSFVQKISRDFDEVIDRNVLAARWSRRTGLDLEHFRVYRVFALWRLAAIVEGAYLLFQTGRVDSDYARKLEYDVPALLDEAAEIAASN